MSFVVCFIFLGPKPERRNMYSILKSIIMSQKEPNDALYHKIDVAWANGDITKEEAESLLKEQEEQGLEQEQEA